MLCRPIRPCQTCLVFLINLVRTLVNHKNDARVKFFFGGRGGGGVGVEEKEPRFTPKVIMPMETDLIFFNLTVFNLGLQIARL